MNLIVGDSHTYEMTFNNSIHLLCSAGSAKGLNNPNSISQYYKLIANNIHNNNYKHCFFLFGGVDVDFSYFFKYLMENETINYIDFNLNVIQNYLKFITDNFPTKSIIILSIGLPVLDDINLKKGLINEHITSLENVNASLLQNKIEKSNFPDIFNRTLITQNFNQQLEKYIKDLNMPNIKYLDITTFTYDENLKHIKNEFFTKVDHHNYERNKYYTAIINDFINSSLN